MPEISSAFVVIMGIGTVFFGLICLILLTVGMSKICKMLEKMVPADAPAASAAPAAAVPAPAAPIPNRQALIAAIAAAIAEDMGEDVSGIRILSVKQL